MNNQHNQHEELMSDIEYWANMWDEIRGEDIHPEPESLQQSGSEDPYDMAMDIIHGQEDDPRLFQESKSVPNSVVPDNFIDHSKQNNPIHPDSGGPDHKTTPAVWLDEESLKEIEDLKNRMFKLENDLAAHMGGGKKWTIAAHDSNNEKMMSEIESLRDKIEKVSSKFGLEKGLSDAYNNRRHMGFNGAK